MANQPTQLEQSFRDICARHDLTALHITGRPTGGFSAYVHWDGFARDGNACQHGSGDSFNQAIANALERAAVSRTPLPSAVELASEPLPMPDTTQASAKAA